MKTIYNSKSKEECVSLDALENSSTLFSFGAPDPWPAIRNELPANFIVWLDRERISCLSPQYILSREADCCKTIDFFYFYYLELR